MVGRERREWIDSDEWDFVSPNRILAPRFSIEKGLGGTRTAVIAEGNARPQCIGYARRRVRLTGGAWYKIAVKLRFQGLDSIESHAVHGLYGEGFSGGVLSLRVDGQWASGEGTFPGPATDMDAELRLYFRLSAAGRVRWESVELEECDPAATRPVSIACHHGPVSGTPRLEYWERWLDVAGTAGAHVALLPELFHGFDPARAEAADGPAARLLSEKARRWGMLTCGTRYERRGDLVFNTARLFGRAGELAGMHDKQVLFEPELDLGVSPGTGNGVVFQTNVGRIGIVTCYEGWFPEVSGSLARDGAEILLFPNVGYYVPLGAARAADHGLCVAASSLNHAAGVWDSSGARAGETEPEPSQDSPTAVLTSRLSLADRMLLATVDLSRKYSPHWKGGAMSSAPAGRAVRWSAMRTRAGGNATNPAPAEPAARATPCR